jgi:hypothetical protein
LPLSEQAYLYDYKTFDNIKEKLKDGSFINFTDEFLKNKDQFYYNDKGYYCIKYLDEDDKAGYKNDTKFEYKINSDYFRNNHFKTITDKSNVILSAGCSITFGQGLPEKYTWPRLLEQSIINETNSIEVINLGSPGLDISLIIKNIMSFIYKYGKPKTILALFPSMSRQLIFHEGLQRYTMLIPNLFYLEKPKGDKTLFNKTKNYVFEDSLYYTSNQIRLFEKFCKNSGINLIWSSWQQDDLKIYRELDFENYLDSKRFIIKDAGESNFNIEDKYKKYSLLARDAAHPGVLYSKNVSLGFFEELKKND